MANSSKVKYLVYRTILIIFVIADVLYFFQFVFDIQDGSQEDIGISLVVFAFLILFTVGLNGRVKQIKEDLN